MAQANPPESGKSQVQSGQGGQQAQTRGTQGQRQQGQGQQQRGQGAQELLRRGTGRGTGSSMRPFEDMERMFDAVFPRGTRPFGSFFDWPSWERAMPAARAQVSMPAVDVIDHENEIVVRAEVPGCTREDLDLSMSDSTLTIRGHSSQEQHEENEDYYYQEIGYGEFSRSVSLPAEVNADKAQATIKDGILEVTLPKAEASKRRSIKIE